jgi:hypothetical protein
MHAMVQWHARRRLGGGKVLPVSSRGATGRALGNAFIGGEGAPVANGDGGTVLQCRHKRGEVRAASNGDNSGRWEVSP